MKWNEKVAYCLSLIGGISGIIGSFIAIMIDIDIGGKFIMGGFILVWTGVAFIPPPMLVMMAPLIHYPNNKDKHE